MSALRVAVVGTGHLGKIHAKLARQSSEIELVAVVDPVREVREAIANEQGCRAAADVREVLGDIEAAIVASPTVTHHAVARDLLAAGKHVLVEKPITTTLSEAQGLCDLANRAGCVLQVGHVERFNPGFEVVSRQIDAPKYLHAVRASGFTFRSTDVGVVLDLMIHDIDATLALVGSTVTEVSAIGISVLGQHEDLAHAHLRFANGATAHLVASRVSYAPARSMQVFTDTQFAAIDFASRTATLVTPRRDVLQRRFAIDQLSADEKNHLREQLFTELLVREEVQPPANNAIADEHADFARSIRERRAPRVTGDAGRQALEVAQAVLDSIARHQWDGTQAGRVGALAMPVLPEPATILPLPSQPVRRRRAG